MSVGRVPRGTDWRSALEDASASTIARVIPVAGGDIAESQRVEFADGAAVFLKQYTSLDARNRTETKGIACAEAAGLLALAEADALPVAQPIAWDEDWLALEWIESAAPAADYDESLGVGLANLHAQPIPAFGGDAPNWIGRLPQDNRPERSWVTFYRERRLRPLLSRARQDGRISVALDARFDRLFGALDRLVGPEEPPAMLHGDLWSGNVLPDERGRPCLIDPSVYGGHREMDLAMMRLFGGFSPRIFECYAEASPLADGAEARVALYQLYPLLVHVCLFGGSYVSQLERSVERVLEND